MTPHAPILGWLLAGFLFVVVLAMIATLVWGFSQLLMGRPVFPLLDTQARVVPWGLPTILLVFGLMIAVYFAVPFVYLAYRDGLQARLGNQARNQVAAKPSPPEAGSLELAHRSADLPRATKKSGNEPASPPHFSLVEKMSLISVINGLLIVLVPVVVGKSSGASWSSFGLSRAHVSASVRPAVIGFLLFTPLVLTINGFAQHVLAPTKHPIEEMLRQEISPSVVALAFLSAVVCAPLAEELIFRGILQAGLRRIFDANGTTPDPAVLQPGAEGLANNDPVPAGDAKVQAATDFPDDEPTQGLLTKCVQPKTRSPLPVLITSVLFAAAHWEVMPTPIALFFFSLMLGRIFERTGHLMSAILLHALFNGFNTTFMVVILLLTNPHERTRDPAAANDESRNGKPGIGFLLAPGAKTDKMLAPKSDGVVRRVSNRSVDTSDNLRG